MKRLTEYLFGLRRGERGTALLLTAYHFLLLLCLYLLKPVRDGLFLGDQGAGGLPIVFMLVAAATVPASLFQRWLSRRFRLDQLTNRLTVAHVVVLLGVGGLALADVPGAAYAVYVYVSIYGLLATAQFWLFANELLDSAQSKRTFAVLNLGGILGAVVGGELTGGLLAETSATPAMLLFVAAGVLAGTLPLVAWIRRYRERQGEAPSATAQVTLSGDPPPGLDREEGLVASLRETVSGYPLVGWIAALVALISVVSTLLDYQLKTIAFATFPGEAALATFMGHFYGRVSLVALGLQLLLTTGLRRYVRTTSVLWVLPAALALGTTVLLLVPGLAAATLLRGADQSLKHSIDKTGRELLYVPLPGDVKRRIKVPLDLVVDQCAHGIGGVLLLGLVSGFGVGAVEVGGAVLILLLAWIGAVIGARRQYLRQFRVSLLGLLRSQRQASRGETTARRESPSEVRHAPTGTVGSDAHRERALRHVGRYLIFGQLLALRKGAEPTASGPVDLAQLPSEATLRDQRRQALGDFFDALARWAPAVQQCDPEDLRLVFEGLRHSSPRVRSDAVSFLDEVLSGFVRRRLIPVLDDPDGHLAMKNAPPLYLFAIFGGDDLNQERSRGDRQPVPTTSPLEVGI